MVSSSVSVSVETNTDRRRSDQEVRVYSVSSGQRLDADYQKDHGAKLESEEGPVHALRRPTGAVYRQSPQLDVSAAHGRLLLHNRA
ncbi:hypothetical protein K0M31_015402 [Melipona bicolor]|uniref:Uncharacterized protein n=1 Tax=Melipona bicolor TaxID=60889 RepID=A0AA40FFL5_9HYME|nr:hypothetical protein K0M31_015402 [Melipona bicolor]